MLMLKGLIAGLFQLTLFSAMLLIPAGTLDWPRALQFLCVYGVVLLSTIALLARFAPSSLEARLEPLSSKSQPGADRVITFLLILSVLAWIVFIPVDVFRLRLFPAPGAAVSILGAYAGSLGFGIIVLALFRNSFAVPIVRDQSERAQMLVDTGVYGMVRHPFYLGLLLFFVGIGLWLGSYASVLLLSIIFAVLAARMQVEEKTLRQKLSGYNEYARKVRFRIVPYIW